MKSAKLKLGAILMAGVAAMYAFINPSFGYRSEASRPAAPDGAAQYGGKCALCHGKDGKGLPTWRAKGQPDFTDETFQKSRTDQQLSDSIHNGKGKYMPAFKGKLSEEDMAALVAQVRAFGKKR